MKKAVAGCVLAALLPLSASAPATSHARRPLDAERDCRELVPAAYSAPVLSADDGRTVRYDVLVFTDGVERTWARTLIEEARASYAPLSVRLKATLRPLDLPADGSFDGRPTAGTVFLFDALRDAVGGKRPARYDAVMLLTEKSMYSFTDGDGDGQADESERQHGTIGEAACAGGVRWPETAFALADARFSSDAKQVGITVAHELGHLLGGHHHLANCTEGVREAAATPCTVMWAYSLAIASTFTSANAAIVRGHAVTYASP